MSTPLIATKEAVDPKKGNQMDQKRTKQIRNIDPVGTVAGTARSALDTAIYYAAIQLYYTGRQAFRVTHTLPSCQRHGGG